MIGSGFGASAAALALTETPSEDEAGVLMLERGMPYPPGSFARTPRELRANFWDPDAALYGLFELWSFRHVRSLVASGLGGGSLIYANVLLPKPADTFTAPDLPNGGLPWPVTADELHDEYQAAQTRLQPAALPAEYASGPSPRVPKAAAFQAAAGRNGLTAEPAPVAIRFTDRSGRARPGREFDDGSGNLHGLPRRSCSLIGECDLGCNQGAKHSLDYAYHSELLSRGVRIFTCCEAIEIRALPDGGYRVRWREHRAAREMTRRRYEDGRSDALLDPTTDQPAPEAGDTWIRQATAPVVILGAGTFGSTRLLLGSRRWLPHLSDQLGRRFSTNGDLLTFARDCRARDGNPRRLDPSAGPVITTVARATVDGQQLWMQDAGGPSLSEWLWQAAALPAGMWSARELLPALVRGRRGGRVSRLAARAVGRPGTSSAMLPMLTMGRDVSGGRLRLQGAGMELDWDPDGDSGRHFAAAGRLARQFAHGLGGRLSPPGFARLARGLTAHPLGGCPMGETPATGVVDGWGEAHGHDGLFVCDGSIMPGPVGPNPSLTIAALGARVGARARDRMGGVKRGA